MEILGIVRIEDLSPCAHIRPHEFVCGAFLVPKLELTLPKPKWMNGLPIVSSDGQKGPPRVEMGVPFENFRFPTLRR